MLPKITRCLRVSLPVMTAGFLFACSGEAEPVRAQVASGLSPAHCIESIEAGTAADAARCPGFLLDAIREGRDVCRDAGGRLIAAPETSIWSIDVNDDSALEYAFDYDSIVDCEGAWSLFSCGSLGCPRMLYEQSRGAWRRIAALDAYAPEQVAALDAATGGYRTLRVGCAGTEPCAEHWFYEWGGTTYDASRLEVRGFDVDFAGSVHGLYPLVEATDVLATPESGAAAVGRYDADTEVAIIGTAEGADYYYVSPCNACESGFVTKAAVRVP